MNFLIRRKTFISMLFIGLSMLGYISWRNLPVELYPNAEFPSMIVQVSSLLEVDPAYMENQGIIPLEGAIGTLEDIEELSSNASSRRGMIFVRYSQETNMKFAWLKLQEKVATVRNKLPEEFLVSVHKVDTEQLASAFMGLQVRGSGGIDRVRNLVDQKVMHRFENIDGIASVSVNGGRVKSVEIRYDKKACDALSITPARIRSVLQQNLQNRVGVGQIYEHDKKISVNLSAEYNSIETLENLVVMAQGTIRLRDVAEVFIGVKEEETFSRVNGKDAVTLQLVPDQQVNLIDLSHESLALIEVLNRELKPEDLEIVVQSNRAETMEESIDEIIELGLTGGLLAVIILWFFLRNIRLALSIALSIPVSIFTAFNLFYYFGITINNLTLVGMALAIGMLVDNSIVVLENIYRLVAHKRDPGQAVMQGTREMFRSVFAATLTTISVFLPFIFSSNFLSRLFGFHVGISIISTLLVSLAVALLLIPALVHFQLSRRLAGEALRARRAQPQSPPEGMFSFLNRVRQQWRSSEARHSFEKVSRINRFVQIYIMMLKSCLRFPARTIIGAVVAFFVTLLLAFVVSISVQNEIEDTDFALYLTMPAGATLDATDKMTGELEERLKTLTEKRDIVSKIFEDEAVITISMQDDYKEIKGRDLAQIKADIQGRINNFKAAEVSFDQPQSSQRFQSSGRGQQGANFMRMLGIGQQTEEVVIKGSDFERMRGVAENVQYYLEELSTIQNAGLNIAENRPELHLTFDTRVMNQYGIPLTAVSSELASFRNEFNAGVKFRQNDHEYDIMIIDRDAERRTRKTFDDLKLLPISGSDDASHELQQLSQLTYATGISGINRVNQEKQIKVSYRYLAEITDSNTALESARQEIDDIVSNLSIPAGIAVEVNHMDTDYSEFYFLIGLAIMLIYMILAAVFESFTMPFVLMLSIPLALIGSFLALTLTGNSLLSLNTIVGFMILLGVVVNNGIILIDYAKTLQGRGYRHSRALLMAGLARLRPILITAITTIVALLPLAMGDAEQAAAIGAPFAITIIGGLALSTLLTLIFIPTCAAALENALAWLRHLSLPVQLLQLVVLSGSCWFIYYEVDDFVRQIIYLLLVLPGIPALTLFVMTSFRRASETVIASDEELHLRITNLVKIYGRDSRARREWKKGKITRTRREMQGLEQDAPGYQLLWQLTLLGFLCYFTLFYLESTFWIFLFCHLLYFYILMLVPTLRLIGQRKTALVDQEKAPLAGTLLYRLIYWGVPIALLAWLGSIWQRPAPVVVVGLIWFFLLVLQVHARRDRKKMEGRGRLKRWQQAFARLADHIPVIGRRQPPFRALDGISLEIGTGMFGLLGPNGAGKTTLMRIICGIFEQSYGKIRINGIDTLEKREELQGLIGYLPQEFGMYENMTAWEYLNYQGILKKILDKEKRESRVEEVLVAVHMAEHRHEKIGSFSGGMKQRIGIAQILLHLPRILVVDEPTAGLDPSERIRFRNLLVELSRERIVIFSTHIIEDISSSCSKVAVLNQGRMRYLGDPLKMTELAVGKVWQFKIAQQDFEKIQFEHKIIHHMSDGDGVRVRCLSATRPDGHAQQVKPSLEDAYLWLQSDKGTDEN